MKDWISKLVIIALLAIVVGVPFVLRPSATVQQPRSESKGIDDRANQAKHLKLVIVSPHNQQIRFEISHAFNRWRKSHGKSVIEFDWRASGGTSDLRKQIIAEYDAAAKRALNAGGELQGVGYDLFFGGGDYDHGKLAEMRSVQTETAKGKVTLTYHISVPVKFHNDPKQSKKQLAMIYPTATIGERKDGSGGGEPLYYQRAGDEPGRWVGVVLSSFGIVYNNDVIASLGLERPTTWGDLTDTAYRNHVALADPAHSGSITEAYNTILMRTGWNRGWKQIRRIFANARYFTSTSSKVPVDVAAGEAAAGMCIDFYGRFQSGAFTQLYTQRKSYTSTEIDHNETDSNTKPIAVPRVGYVDPPELTKLNADPISVLYQAPHADLAHEFVRWLLSKQGQQLWQVRVASPSEKSQGISALPNGPLQYELRRQPIRHDLYFPTSGDEIRNIATKLSSPTETQISQTNWVDEINPYTIARPRNIGTPSFFGSIATISHAMAIDVHQDLVAAWSAICTCNDPLLKAELEKQFDAMPAGLSFTLPAKQYELRSKDIRSLTKAQRKTLDAHLKSIPGKDDIFMIAYSDIITLPAQVQKQIERSIRHPAYQNIINLWRSDPDQKLRDRLKWTRFFQTNYRDIIRKAQAKEKNLK